MRLDARAGESGGARWRQLLAAVGVILAVGLTAGIPVAQAERSSRRALTDRFNLRGSLAASFVRSYLDEVADHQRQLATRRLAGPVVDPAAVADVTDALGWDVSLVLDGGGRFIAGEPHDPNLVGVDLTGRYPHLAAALAGDRAVGRVVRSAVRGEPLIPMAVSFDTPSGRRVFSGGFRSSATPFGAYLARLLPFDGAAAHVVDDQDNIVSTSDPSSPVRLVDADQPLLAALRRAPAGRYERATRPARFATSPVADTPWRLVVTSPAASLYAPLAGPAVWVPRLLVGVLVVAAAAVMVLLIRARAATALLQQQRAELERSNMELEQFAYVASHDLSEPLRAIGGFASLLQHDLKDHDDETVQSSLRFIIDGAERMQALINDLLAFSRVGRGSQAVESVDLTEVVSDVTKSLTATHPHATITGTTPLPVVRANRTMMIQLFQNVIGNAVKYTKPDTDPVVHIRQVPRGGPLCELAVDDNGIGIDPEHRQRVFRIFQRLHTRAEYAGTGIGLAICSKIAHTFGGEIWIEDSPLGGSSFHLTLPLAGQAER